jgi:hypothetical protein
VARFEEVSTSEYVIQEFDKYLDLLFIVKKENLDENGIIERFSQRKSPHSRTFTLSLCFNFL